ncbi:MAG: antibiotic biosynthesis monooxygenase family protein [Acidimicrobiales bacterium]
MLFRDAPAPPYTAVIFSSVRTDTGSGLSDESGYERTAARMDELAGRQPGYLGIESARDRHGFGITVSYWVDADAAAAWKTVAEHRAAQTLGRERWYTDYLVRVCTVERSYGTPDRPT